MSLRIADLHEAYTSASHDEAIEMANLGAICYMAFKDNLYTKWETSMTEDETVKAVAYREEGRQEGRLSAMETLKNKLITLEETNAKLVAAEGQIQQLRSSIETETARRVTEALENHRKDYELSKMNEIAQMKQKVSYLEGQQTFVHRIEQDNDSLRQVTETLRKELDSLKQTKSSHATGKIGEAVIWDMLIKSVLPRFPYSDAKNMTAVKHMADFHIWIMSPTGNRVKILLDSKKYKDPVPYSEIEKLYSDVDMDEEAQCGIMVSHDTPIYTRSQFQISRTSKGKLCLFMSFEGMDDGFRTEVLSWGLRILANVVSAQSDDSRDVMIDNIEGFLKEIGNTITEIENCSKSCKGLYDSLKLAKDNLVTRLTTFKIACGQEGGVVMAKDHTEVSMTARCTAKTGSGSQCSFRKCANSEFCKKHGNVNVVVLESV